MNRYAVINNNVVTNVVVGDAAFAALITPDNDIILNLDGAAVQPSIGWSYVGGVFAPPTAIPTPDVTPRQFRQALVLSGVSIAAIDAALDSLPEPTRSFAKIEWEYSTAFIRRNPLVNTMGAMLGWSSAQLDSLWALAKTL